MHASIGRRHEMQVFQQVMLVLTNASSDGISSHKRWRLNWRTHQDVVVGFQRSANYEAEYDTFVARSSKFC